MEKTREWSEGKLRDDSLCLTRIQRLLSALYTAQLACTFDFFVNLHSVLYTKSFYRYTIFFANISF